MLTAENYSKGFLIDEELMGGVAPAEAQGEAPAGFAAYVLRHTTGEYLGYERYPTVEAALSAINAVKRDWHYERTSACGQCSDGDCTVNRGESCKMAACADGAPAP